MIKLEGFEEVFSDMAEQAKPINAEESATAQEYDRGVADCIKGIKHEDQSAAYNAGYCDEYSYQMAKQGVSYAR